MNRHTKVWLTRWKLKGSPKWLSYEMSIQLTEEIVEKLRKAEPDFHVRAQHGAATSLTRGTSGKYRLGFVPSQGEWYVGPSPASFVGSLSDCLRILRDGGVYARAKRRRQQKKGRRR